MNLIGVAQSRARAVVGILVLLLIAGSLAFVTIPKESDPDIDIPIVYVSMVHFGISPQDAERLLVRPMETALRSIEGIKEIRSTSYQSGANVLLEFDAGLDIDQALLDVREKVDQAKTELPDDSEEPTVDEVNLSLFPVLVVTLSGDVPERTLMRLARDLQDKIEGIPSVLEVNIGGDRDEQVEIVIDPAQLESYGLDAGELLVQLGRSNQLIAAGAVDTGQGRFAVKVPGLFETTEDLLNMPIKVNNDAVVTAADVATIRRTFEDRDTHARVNGKPAAVLEVSKRSGENIIETIAAVRELVIAEQATWPGNVEVNFAQDKSTIIKRVLGDLQNNVLMAVLLVMIVVVAVLGLRSGILVAISIPGSFLTAVLVLQLLGLTVNIVVMFSLILSIGLLVDGTIVVTEYADRKMREGIPPEEAYQMAARTMAWPITASTATTLAAFAPLLFWPGLVGEFMKFMPITLLTVLTASLAMALIFVPILGTNLAALARILLTAIGTVAGAGVAGLAAFNILTRVLGWQGGALVWAPVGLVVVLGGIFGAYAGIKLGHRATRGLGSGQQSEEDAVQMRALAGDGDGDLSKLKGATGLFARVLGAALRNPVKVVLGAVVVLVSSWTMYIFLGNGVEFFPDIEPDQALVQVHARGNLAVDEKDGLVREVERHVLDIQDERGEFTSIYTLAGNAQTRDDRAEDIVGTISLEFGEWDERRPANEILADIAERTRGLAGIIVETRKAEQGPPTGKAIQVQLSSNNPELLAVETAKVRRFVDGMEGLKDLEDSRPMPGIEWELTVDRAEAAKFGADVQLIGNAIKLVTNGIIISSFRPDDSDDEIDIVARYPLAYRTVSQLDVVRIKTRQGLVPISNFVKRQPVPRTGQLRRTDTERSLTVKADVLPGILVDEKVREIRSWLETADINPRVSVVFKGEDQEQKDAQAFLLKAFSVALFLIALILILQFNSFYSAFLILTAILISTSGVMLGLLVTGQPFGIVMSGVGVIALAGIVVNNNIVLIDAYNNMKQKVADPYQAILRAVVQRFRPVLLTTATTTLGLMPMVLQLNINFVTREVARGAPSTQWWVQLATAITAGLFFAVVPTLVVTPAALMIRENLRGRKKVSVEPAREHANTVGFRQAAE